MQHAGGLSPEEFWAQVAEGEQHVMATTDDLPCYGIVGWSGPIAIGEWAFQGSPHGLTHGSLSGIGPRVDVLSTQYDAHAQVVALRMGEAEPPDDHEDFRHRQQELEAEEPHDVVQILVDDTPVSFQLWSAGDRWWAAAEHEGYGLVLVADEITVDEIALHRVTEFEPYLAGRREQLRGLSGDA